MKHIKNKHFDYYKDDNGLIQGEYKNYYDNGKLFIYCYYKDDKHHGIYKDYYYNGNLRNICNFINGNIHGEDKYYNEDGSYDYSYYFNHGKECFKDDLGDCILFPVDNNIVKKHSVTIDGITKELSEESFKNLKELFK